MDIDLKDLFTQHVETIWCFDEDPAQAFDEWRWGYLFYIQWLKFRWVVKILFEAHGVDE